MGFFSLSLWLIFWGVIFCSIKLICSSSFLSLHFRLYLCICPCSFCCFFLLCLTRSFFSILLFLSPSWMHLSWNDSSENEQHFHMYFYSILAFYLLFSFWPCIPFPFFLLYSEMCVVRMRRGFNGFNEFLGVLFFSWIQFFAESLSFFFLRGNQWLDHLLLTFSFLLLPLYPVLEFACWWPPSSAPSSFTDLTFFFILRDMRPVVDLKVWSPCESLLMYLHHVIFFSFLSVFADALLFQRE